MDLTLKLAENKEIQAKIFLADPSWDRLNDEVRKSLKSPQNKYTLRYRDDEGDFVTLTSQNELEEMLRSGVKEILISSPQNAPIQFMSRNLQPIQLAGLKFFTWTSNEQGKWHKGYDLTFDAYEKPYVNNTPLNSSPMKEESVDGFQGISIQWKHSAQHNFSGYCLFYHSSQLRIGNSKGKIYWPNLIENIDCIVFNGWIEYYGQTRQYWKGAVLDLESMLKMPQLPPLDTQILEETKQIHKYILQLNRLWDIGHRDIKRNVYLLQRFEGNLSLVVANI